MTTNFLENRIKNAKNKLSQHKTLGIKSSLSIYEVANLMDTVRSGEQLSNDQSSSIFFSWN